MPQGGYAATYHDLLAELRKRQVAVMEQQNLVDRYVINLLGSANLSPEREVPKKRHPKGNQYRNGSQFVPGFVIDALNELPVEIVHVNGKIKTTTP